MPRFSSLSFISGAQQCAASFRSLGSKFPIMRRCDRVGGMGTLHKRSLLTYPHNTCTGTSAVPSVATANRRPSLFALYDDHHVGQFSQSTHRRPNHRAQSPHRIIKGNNLPCQSPAAPLPSPLKSGPRCANGRGTGHQGSLLCGTVQSPSPLLHHATSNPYILQHASSRDPARHFLKVVDLVFYNSFLSQTCILFVTKMDHSTTQGNYHACRHQFEGSQSAVGIAPV
ncbi:hypothetical protein CDEST_02640 [Colletotrichum destructivum]|uniref:Uncharacterized protein n=1 Tax=Colletotrichum destructivum TaxID=34406 RepID=A0AAX4I344_9PEZI|nr:hypothetical protein CDEST_02640 [Colletotrichum destructivum]